MDSDASARRIRTTLHEHTGASVAVIVTDSFGRPFRRGTTDIAIGVAGLAPGQRAAVAELVEELGSAHPDGRGTLEMVVRETLEALAHGD